MAKRKDFARRYKDIDNGVHVVTGQGIGYWLRMGWDLKGRE